MAFHKCTICAPDGTVLAKDVQLALEAGRSDADKWYGTLTVTHLSNLEAGKQYLLMLDDGRKGSFAVRRNTFAGEVTRAVAIQGATPLQ